MANADDTKVWDAVAAQYDSYVLDNFASDLNGVLTARLTEACDGVRALRAAAAAAAAAADGEPAKSEGSTPGTAAAAGAGGGLMAVDFGCGAGKWLPALAARCERVLGIDFSIELLRGARTTCASAPGLLLPDRVQLLQRDLGEPWPLLLPLPAQQAGGTGGSAGEAEGGWWPRADVAVCANVIMSRNPQTRRVMLENLSRSLRPGGALLLVVPAAESVEIVRRRQGDWLAACAEHGLQAAEAIPEDELREHQEEGGGRGGGVYSRAGVLQKHWRRGTDRGSDGSGCWAAAGVTRASRVPMVD